MAYLSVRLEDREYSHFYFELKAVINFVALFELEIDNFQFFLQTLAYLCLAIAFQEYSHFK